MATEDLNLWQRWLRRPQGVWLRRALFQIHLWTGIGTGLYVLLISVTGSAIVFRNEIYQSAGAGARKVEVRGAKLPAEDLKKIIREKYPTSSLSFVFEGKQPTTATEVWLERGKERIQRLFDPYTGADLGDSVPRSIRVVRSQIALGGATGDSAVCWPTSDLPLNETGPSLRLRAISAGEPNPRTARSLWTRSDTPPPDHERTHHGRRTIEGHHQLRRNRLDPYTDHVTVSATDTAADR